MKRIFLFVLSLTLLLAACAEKPSPSSSEIPGSAPPPSSAPTVPQNPSSPAAPGASKPGELPEVVLSIRDGTYALDAAIPAVLSNRSDSTLYFSPSYTIEGEVNGIWTVLKWHEDRQRMWPAIAQILNPGEEADFSFVIEKGEFDPDPAPGLYRLVKQVTVETTSSGSQLASSLTLTAEFTLGE